VPGGCPHPTGWWGHPNHRQLPREVPGTRDPTTPRDLSSALGRRCCYNACSGRVSHRLLCMPHPFASTAQRINSTNTPHTRLLLFLAGQRIHTTGRCDADVSEIPRLKRRPVRVGGATGRPWGPTTRRERAGRVGGGRWHSHSAHGGCEVVRGGGGEMVFLGLWMGLR
jgi:hypothetical protein